MSNDDHYIRYEGEELNPDILHIECPECSEVFPVHINSVYANGKTYGIENAPLYALAEVNFESRRGTIVCIHCHMSVYVEVYFAAKARRKSLRDRDGWQYS